MTKPYRLTSQIGSVALAGLLTLWGAGLQAEDDPHQVAAKASIDRLNVLLSCAEELEPEYAGFSQAGHSSGPNGLFSLHITPRVIRVVVFPGHGPDPMGGNWELIFEFTENEIYVLDQSLDVDPNTFLTEPRPLPEFPHAPEMTRKAKDAFVECGAVWLGYWEYTPTFSIGGVGFDSLLPTD